MVLFLLAWPVISAAQTPPNEIPAVADPKLGLLLWGSSPLDNNFRETTSSFLYEAVRSGSFGIVETRTNTSISGRKPITRYDRYTYVTDFARCAELDRQLALAAPLEQLSAPVRIFPKMPYDEDLVKGSCVIGTEILHPTARYFVSKYGLLDLTTDTFLIEEGRLSDPIKIWAAFGLKRQNATRWNDTGSRKRPDNASDAELSRALLLGNSHIQSAAIRLLSDRLSLISIPLGPYYRFVLVQTTGRQVGNALVTSGVLRDMVPHKRAMAIRAAAAVPDAADTLFPAIMAAVSAPLNPLDESQVQQREEFEKRKPGMGQMVFGPPNPMPGYEDSDVFGAAALAAAMFGPSYAQAFIEKFPERVKFILHASPATSSTEAIFLLVAVAPDREQTILALLSESNSTTLSNDQRRARAASAARIVSHVKQLPPTILEEVRKRCTAARTVSGWGWDERLCSSILARSGDHATFDRLVSILKGSLTKPNTEIERWQAAQILIASGEVGMAAVRQFAMTGLPNETQAAFTALCGLGRGEAGVEIIEKLRSNATALGDGNLIRLAEFCSEPEPTNIERVLLDSLRH